MIGLWRQPNAEGLTPLPYHPADNPAHAHLASSATSRSGTVSSRAGAGAVAGHAALDMSQASDPSEKGSAGPRASSIPLRPAFNPPKKTIYHAFPPLLVFRPLVRLFAWSEAKRLEAQKGKRMRRKYVGANVPLEISMFLSTWVSKVIRRKTMDPPFVTSEFWLRDSASGREGLVLLTQGSRARRASQSYSTRRASCRTRSTRSSGS